MAINMQRPLVASDIDLFFRELLIAPRQKAISKSMEIHPFELPTIFRDWVLETKGSRPRSYSYHCHYKAVALG